LTITSSVIPIVKYPVPIEWALTFNSDTNLESLLNKKMLDISSKECKQLYHDVGMFYFIKTDALYEENTLFTNNCEAYILQEKECQDIDTIEDWEYAELKYKILKEINK
jgi:N-acylneuraminate cytidylyltransferase